MSVTDPVSPSEIYSIQATKRSAGTQKATSKNVYNKQDKEKMFAAASRILGDGLRG